MFLKCEAQCWSSLTAGSVNLVQKVMKPAVYDQQQNRDNEKLEVIQYKVRTTIKIKQEVTNKGISNTEAEI